MFAQQQQMANIQIEEINSLISSLQTFQKQFQGCIKPLSEQHKKLSNLHHQLLRKTEYLDYQFKKKVDWSQKFFDGKIFDRDINIMRNNIQIKFKKIKDYRLQQINNQKKTQLMKLLSWIINNVFEQCNNYPEQKIIQVANEANFRTRLIYYNLYSQEQCNQLQKFLDDITKHNSQDEQNALQKLFSYITNQFKEEDIESTEFMNGLIEILFLYTQEFNKKQQREEKKIEYQKIKDEKIKQYMQCKQKIATNQVLLKQINNEKAEIEEVLAYLRDRKIQLKKLVLMIAPERQQVPKTNISSNQQISYNLNNDPSKTNNLSNKLNKQEQLQKQMLLEIQQLQQKVYQQQIQENRMKNQRILQERVNSQSKKLIAKRRQTINQKIPISKEEITKQNSQNVLVKDKKYSMSQRKPNHPQQANPDCLLF